MSTHDEEGAVTLDPPVGGLAAPSHPTGYEAQPDSQAPSFERSCLNIDSQTHATGQSQYIDDIALPEGTLHAHVFYSQMAHASILSLNTDLAAKMPGVIRIFTAKDIPGVNQIGGIVPDEPLLAEDSVHFWGQPVALVVADDDWSARAASALIELTLQPLPVITDPREAASAGEFLIPPVTFARGDADKAFADCDVVITGKAESGGQEHLYLEPQGAIAVPVEGGGIHITSSTQGPTAVQRAVAKVLGMPMHQIEVDVRRLGGGFGGKEDQATPWAALAALAAERLRRPVKLVLERRDDMRMTGKRHPYSSDFKIGLQNDGRILAYEVTFYQNGGAAADLSPAVLSRSLFHATNAYYIPHVKALGLSCRTNLPPNTAFRGFGGPQGMFVIEAAIRQAAEAMGLTAEQVQKMNLLQEGDEFHYGQVAHGCQARSTWQQAEEAFDPAAVRARIDAFNRHNSLVKRGLAFMPICFGISFTNTPMNQASALVHIYQDGSVSVSTAAVEMGQGVNTKILQVAAETLGIKRERLRILSTNTSRVANTSPTAASSGADLNGRATELACLGLRERLLSLGQRLLGLDSAAGLSLQDERLVHADSRAFLGWQALIEQAYLQRISLSSQTHYATPQLHFDTKTAKGSPFAYHVYGTALTEVSLDCLRGRYRVERVGIVHDFGRSLNWPIDLGQVEGALMQGIGWMTLEEVLFNDQGKPLTDTLSTYKVPDWDAAPAQLDVRPLTGADNPWGVFNSKAVGEPPLMYGIGTFFALRDAMQAFRGGEPLPCIAPLTPERVLTQLYDPLEL